MIADNYATHKQTKVEARLARRPRFHMHCTPTSGSWMNLVERFFADSTQECVQSGSFRSVPQLTRAITAYMEVRGEQPKPYRWETDGAEILAKIQRAREALAGAAQDYMHLRRQTLDEPPAAAHGRAVRGGAPPQRTKERPAPAPV